MAVTIASCPGNTETTLTVSNQAREILFSSEVTKVTLRFGTNAGKLALTGTDGGAISSPSYPITADVDWEFRVRPAGKVAGGKQPRVLIAAAVVPTTVQIFVEED